jgi:hypothetical protein
MELSSRLGRIVLSRFLFCAAGAEAPHLLAFGLLDNFGTGDSLLSFRRKAAALQGWRGRKK